MKWNVEEPEERGSIVRFPKGETRLERDGSLNYLVVMRLAEARLT